MSEDPCTCGSGAHPRKCEKHPLAMELHCAELTIDSLADERDEVLFVLTRARQLIAAHEKVACCLTCTDIKAADAKAYHALMELIVDPPTRMQGPERE